MDRTDLPAAPGADKMTPKDFNLWCALNSRPFRLVQHVWPDGSTEWDIEVQPGRPDATTAYGTGQNDPMLAAVAAFAFVAGIEWAESSQRELTADPEEDEESDADL